MLFCSFFISLITLLISCSATRGNVQNYYYCTHERIVTSLLDIDSANGVPLDFRYNETVLQYGAVTSAPGCPKSIDGYPWIYYDKRCYLAGRQGPCPTGQVLFIQSGTVCGVCGCECLLNDGQNMEMSRNQGELQNYQFCYSGTSPQGQVYDKFDKTVCFNIHEQGPCPSGKLLGVIWPASFDWMTNSSPSPSITCLPPCDLNDNNWSTEHNNGKCVHTSGGQGGIASAAGFLANIGGHNCLEEERYSETLRKCVKKHPKLSLSVG